MTDSEASGGFVYSGEGLHEGVLGVHFLRNVAEVHGEEGFHYAGRELGGSVGGEGSGGGGGGFLVALVLLGVFGARGFLRDFLLCGEAGERGFETRFGFGVSDRVGFGLRRSGWGCYGCGQFKNDTERTDSRRWETGGWRLRGTVLTMSGMVVFVVSVTQ